MTNQQYHADTTRISKSGLDLIRRSPAHYYAHYLSPNKLERVETQALFTGTASHALILEPDKFDAEYYLFDDSHKVAELERNGAKRPRLTKEYKEWMAEIEAENIGRVALPPKDYEYYRQIQNSLNNHSAARALLSNGVAETTVVWEDFETGAPCKCRPDWLDYSSRLIVDLKFVADASPQGFGKASYNHRYYVQAPFYTDGVLASALDFIPVGFAFIAVEKTPPYAVAVYFTPAEVMSLGRRHYTEDLETYMECRRSGVWPAYPEQIQELNLPRWAFN